MIPRLRDYHPIRLLNRLRETRYQRLPNNNAATNGHSSRFDTRLDQQKAPPWSAAPSRFFTRLSLAKLIGLAITLILIVVLLGGGGYHHHRRKHSKQPDVAEDNPLPFYWQQYNRLNGYYNGIRTLVPYAQYVPENGYNITLPQPALTAEEKLFLPDGPPMDPIAYNPYPDWSSPAYLATHPPHHECFLDAADTLRVPDIYAYPGLPQHTAEPLYGSHHELGLDDTICFDRYGRLGPYGFGYNASQGGLGPGNASERTGSEKIFAQTGIINYTAIDWGSAQRRCLAKNAARFNPSPSADGKPPLPRQAYVLRTWTGFFYNDHHLYTLRAMLAELALKSGAEYDVHLLVHVKDASLPIWASAALYDRVLRENVPPEFHNISTLWSEAQMRTYYPDPFPDNFANMAGSNIHGVYRSAHFALQWFAQTHAEYEFFWNWEMDVRYSGHYYEFHQKVGAWAKKQPRKGLWERGRRFWIPKFHGEYAAFTTMVERETQERDIAANDVAKSGPVPIWGPVQGFPNRGMLPPPNSSFPPTTYAEDKYEWGVGEEADLITFNPLFDPSLTNWVFSWDITGYNRTLPPPPRRAAIVTISRLSRKLLDIMHEETWAMKHTMFAEMWPASVALHHGLKAVYAPHPVYFDRDWEVAYMDQTLNFPKEVWASPFGWGENNLLGSSFYYNSGFSGALWRRWLGLGENGEGGRRWEEVGVEGQGGMGRMCLRGGLHHPVKHEVGPVD